MLQNAEGAFHGYLGLAEHPSVSDGQYGWRERQQLARAFQGQSLMPGSHRRQGEEQFNCSRNSHAALCLEGIATDQGAITRIEKGDMAGSVSGGGNHFERAEAVPFMQKVRRLCGDDGIAALQRNLRLGGVQALISRQKTRVSLAYRHLHIRQSIMQRVQRADMIDVGMSQHNTCNWHPQLASLPHDRLRLAAHVGIDQRKAIILAYQV